MKLIINEGTLLHEEVKVITQVTPDMKKSFQGRVVRVFSEGLVISTDKEEITILFEDTSYLEIL
jgi:ribosome maturation factor RimP